MKMQDIATPNLPSRDFEATSHFYRSLGFVETWRDGGWMILRRGDLLVEFFLHPDFDPNASAFGSCFRLQDVAAFYQEVLAAGVPEQASGRPSAHPPKREHWGGLVGAVIDPDGSLLRLVQAPD
jgi:catechol 2,3-dioxygenase-like lactoylglutathione lyase family enzyme